MCCAVDLHSCRLHCLGQVREPWVVCLCLDDGGGPRVFNTVSNEIEGPPWYSGVFSFLLFGRPMHLLVTHRSRMAVPPMLPVLYSPHIPVEFAGEGWSAGRDIKRGYTLTIAIGVATSAGSARALPTAVQTTYSLTGLWDCHLMLDHVVFLALATQKHQLIRLIVAGRGEGPQERMVLIRSYMATAVKLALTTFNATLT